MKVDEHLVATLAAIPLELERVRTELATGLAQSKGGVRLEGARAVPAGAAGRPIVWASSGRLVGWSLVSTGGTSQVSLVDARISTEGTEQVAVVNLAADTSSTVWLGPGGVSFTEGLYATITGAGTLTGAFWIGAVD
jgi:hypothetical protein